MSPVAACTESCSYLRADIVADLFLRRNDSSMCHRCRSNSPRVSRSPNRVDRSSALSSSATPYQQRLLHTNSDAQGHPSVYGPTILTFRNAGITFRIHRALPRARGRHRALPGPEENTVRDDIMAERIIKRSGGDQRGALRARAYSSWGVVAMCADVTATRARHREAHSRHAPP